MYTTFVLRNGKSYYFLQYGHNDFDIGHWNDLACGVELPYICKVKASAEYGPPAVSKCEGEFSDFDEYLTNCYKNEDNGMSWEDADASCKSNGGTHLISILSVPEQAYAINKVDDKMTWIGLSDKSVISIIMNCYMPENIANLAPRPFQMV